MTMVRARRGTALWLGTLVLVAAIGLGARVARAEIRSCDNLPARGDEGGVFRGHHVIFGAGDINGSPRSDFIVGSDGRDTIHGGGGQDIVCARGGDDVVYGDGMGDDLHGQAGDDRIFGGLLDDELYGEGGDDLLVGGHGVDEMAGGAGSDWLRGGTNADVYVGDDPRDHAPEPGTDVASFADVTPSAEHAGVSGVVVNLTGAPGGGTAVGDGTDDVKGIEAVIGSPFDDVLNADASVKEPKLYGGMGNDACTPAPCAEPPQQLAAPFAYLDAYTPLPGSSPDPMLIAVGASASEDFTLDGGTIGANIGGNAEQLATLAPCAASAGSVSCPAQSTSRGGGVAWFGGAGDDRMTVKSTFPAAKTVDLDGGDGTDAITGGGGDETLYSGASGADTLDGNGGEDALIAEGTGGDHLFGGPGDDQLVTTDPCQAHTFRGGPGTDIAGFARTTQGRSPELPGIHAQLGGVAYKLAARYSGNACGGGAQTSVYADNEILEGTRNSDELVGSDGEDTIWGRQGDDTISGLRRDDRLEGMEGDDTIAGGAGVDILLGGGGGDRLHARDGRRDARVDCGPGNDFPAQADTGRRHADPVVRCEHKHDEPTSEDREPFVGPAPDHGDGVEPGDAGAPAPAPALTPTQAFVTVDQTLNGQPGYATVHGHVLGGDAPLNGVYVNVNFQKQQPDGSWATMSSAHPVVTNGAYGVEYWGVGVGQWRVRTVFPQQGSLAESMSDYHSFEIKHGYRLAVRHSGKCLTLSGNNPANGAQIIQWDCSPSPSPGDGQVLTLVPMGGGFFELRINSSGRCVDVPAASLADGAKLQQWDCLGAGQANQLWQVIPIAGQDGWFAFGVKHSGKCLDVSAALTTNGVRLQQWGCLWSGNQQWRFQAID
jgi:Ca2+-binding RTX toxin-like protein